MRSHARRAHDDDVSRRSSSCVGRGQIDNVRAALDADPQLVHAVGPHPFWGGRPQALHVAIERGRRDLFDLCSSAART